MKPRVDIDIARTVKTIESLKADMLGAVADLFRTMRNGTEEEVVDQLANGILAAYVLGRRLGVDFSRLDETVKEKVDGNIEKPHECEAWYGDFSALRAHLSGRDRSTQGGRTL